VDPTVIHHDDRVGSGKRLHPIEETAYEALKGFCAERAFNNFTVHNAVIARDSGKDRETGRRQKERNMNEACSHRRPRTKKALRCAGVPRIDQAFPRYVVRRSTELSSTKISCSAVYLLILWT
jgi:hypothetical protein